jgi:predicted transcriptional regulator
MGNSYDFNCDKQIKILEYFKKSNGVYFTETHLDDMNYYEIAAIARDLEKKGLTSNNNGILDITEQGKEYLTNTLNSNRDTTQISDH